MPSRLTYHALIAIPILALNAHCSDERTRLTATPGAAGTAGSSNLDDNRDASTDSSQGGENSTPVTPQAGNGGNSGDATVSLAGNGGTSTAGNSGNAGASAAGQGGDTDCSGAFETASAPVLKQASIDCGQTVGSPALALAGASTYLTFRTNFQISVPRISEISAERISTQKWPREQHVTLPASDLDGKLHLLISHVSNEGVGFYRPAQGTWELETVNSPPTSDVNTQAKGLVFSTMGSAFALYRVGSQLFLAERSPAGAWSREALPGNVTTASLALDLEEHPHVVFDESIQSENETKLELRDWQKGRAARTVSTLSDGTLLDLDSAPFSEKGVSIAFARNDGIHVVRPDGDTFQDVLVPGTALTPDTECPGPQTPREECGGVCTQIREDSRGPSLARASDGTLWVAHVRRRVEQDIETRFTFLCAPKYLESRTSAELVIHRIPKAADQASEALRLKLPDAQLEVDLAARDSKLHVVFVTDEKVRYLVVNALAL